MFPKPRFHSKASFQTEPLWRMDVLGLQSIDAYICEFYPDFAYTQMWMVTNMKNHNHGFFLLSY